MNVSMNLSSVNQSRFPMSSGLRAGPLAQMVQPGFKGSLAGLSLDPALLSLSRNDTNLSGINSGFLGMNDYSTGGQGQNAVSMIEILQSLIQMMAVIMQSQTGSADQMPQGSPSFGGPNLGSPHNGNVGGGITPLASNDNGHNVGGHQSSVGGQISAPTAPASPSNGTGASPINIGPGTRVLEIGDSHSVGTFGKELDARLRGTGAQVSTYASAGATASTFAQGKSTKYGYWEKNAGGGERSVGYGKSAQTPRLDNLIAKDKPQVILVNLGANFRGSNPKSQVDQIGQIAKKHGIPIVWVGPPKTAKDNNNPGSLQKFDQDMAAAVAPYGTYVSSNKHTPKYSGGDGLHYGGSQGTQTAKNWAAGVFGDITGH